MIKTVVFGYGNIGRAVVDTVLNSPDFLLVAVVDEFLTGKKAGDITIESNYKAYKGKFDVAIIAVPSRAVPELNKSLLEDGISTVDAFDIHTDIPVLRNSLDSVAKANNAAAIISAGWDPGSDSIIRTLLLAMAPQGITYTNFGPGVSMGHTVAAKSIEGVKDALSLTMPAGAGNHKRMVYIELLDGYDFNTVLAALKADDYFAHDETHVIETTDVNALRDLGHGVHIERKATCGVTPNQLFNYEMRISNPALTAQMLVNAARAVTKQAPGCYTLIEIPPVDLLAISKDEAIATLV